MSMTTIRSGRLAFVSAILLTWLVTASCMAMVYRPSVGRFKDACVLWHEGQFYLFSMYTPDTDANFRNVWMATSSDGVHWKHVGPVIKDAPFNIWAMSVHRVGGRFNYMGATGYGVYTLIADTPRGPFRPDAAAYRLCGNSTRWVALWARFCRTDADLLVNGYMYSGYTYETGETWLPPLKTAVVDSGGHLRLGYWKGNDALKGPSAKFELNACKKVYPDEPNGACTCNVVADRLDLQAQPERHSILRTDVPTTVSILDTTFDFDRGVVVEGTIQATCRDHRLVAPSVGFFLQENELAGTAILLHGYGRTEIGQMTIGDRVEFRREDTIGPGCAAPVGILPHTDTSFRLLIRKNMFELYLDDMFVQTFNTTHAPGSIGATPRRIGFIAQNGQGLFDNVRVWSMNLTEPD